MGFGEYMGCHDLSKASEEQLQDVLFVKKSLACNPENIKYVPKEIYKKICKIEAEKRAEAKKSARGAKKYREAYIKVFNNIMAEDPYALRNAPEFVKENKKIVWMAMERLGQEQLKYAGEQLKMDEDFVLEVLKVYPEAIRYVDALLLVGPTFLVKAYNANAKIAEYLQPYFRVVLGIALADGGLSELDEEILDDNFSL